MSGYARPGGEKGTSLIIDIDDRQGYGAGHASHRKRRRSRVGLSRLGLVKRAERWMWGGLNARGYRGKPFTLANWPVEQARGWTAAVNEALTDKALERIRISVNRGRPCGEQPWVQRTAERLGLTFTLRNPGRPRKPPEEAINQ